MDHSRTAIAALIHLYAERLDGGDLDGVAALFAHGAYGAAGGPLLHGAEALAGVLHRLTKLHADGTPRTKHVVTNLTIEPDEAAGTARARSYFTVFQQTERLPLQAIIAGRYHDRFERVAGAWRFAERLIHIDLAGDLREHLHDALGLAG